jgi:hypothetical protein
VRDAPPRRALVVQLSSLRHSAETLAVRAKQQSWLSAARANAKAVEVARPECCCSSKAAVAHSDEPNPEGTACGVRADPLMTLWLRR